jgi:hypothetical protein
MSRACNCNYIGTTDATKAFCRNNGGGGCNCICHEGAKPTPPPASVCTCCFDYGLVHYDHGDFCRACALPKAEPPPGIVAPEKFFAGIDREPDQAIATTLQHVADSKAAIAKSREALAVDPAEVIVSCACGHSRRSFLVACPRCQKAEHEKELRDRTGNAVRGCIVSQDPYSGALLGYVEGRWVRFVRWDVIQVEGGSRSKLRDAIGERDAEIAELQREVGRLGLELRRAQRGKR